VRVSILLVSVFVMAISCVAFGDGGKAVTESARQIPVAKRVDVVVVGGGTGAVAAAVAAAEKGAKVFLAAPRPYLGEDVCGTLRLWLEPGEKPISPLAKALFGTGSRVGELFEASSLVDLEYKADKPSSGKHEDTKPASLLKDGRWGRATAESVQYDGDVTLTVDLGKEQDLEKVGVLVYHAKDFLVDSATVYTGKDKENWTELREVKNTLPEQKSVMEDAIPLVVAAPVRTRYLRLDVKRAPGSSRLLLGEIVAVKKTPPTTEPAQACRIPAKPLHIKRALDDALLRAGVEFLFSCYATDVLRDGDGKPCGIVMANRAGRQAVVAKAIIDATDRAWVARMAGAQFRPFPAGEQTLKRVVIGMTAREGEGLRARRIGKPYVAKVKVGPRGKEHYVTRTYQTVEYTWRLPMSDGGHASWAKAEQTARDRTYDPEQQFASEILFLVPPDPMKGEASSGGAWQGVENVDLRAARPAGVPRFWVLGGCADVPRDHAEKLLRPLALMDMGARVGAAAAEEAKALPAPAGVRVAGRQDKGRAAGEVREVLVGVRPTQSLPTIPQDARALPVLGEYDVVVVGGGTSGAPAGIGAARYGARTLVVEYQHGLGGVGTLGSITKYCCGYRKGFTKEVYGGASWQIEQRMEWWRTTLRKAGAEIWFGCLGCGALVEGNRVTGVVVATPEGRGVVRAKVVIDSTGNADIAAAAGASCVYTGAADIALQGTGLPCRDFGISYFNTDFTMADETDMVDTWQLFIYAKLLYGNAFDLGQLIDTRERRRIAGDFTMTILDQVNGRTYGDTVVHSSSAFDTHGYTVAPYFALADPKSLRTSTPYRCLLPKGYEGLLATGLGMSVQRDALPVLRMQPDLQNQGYAAGRAAAMAAKSGVALREIDLRLLQKHLVEIGSLPDSVLTDKDSSPVPEERIREAVAKAKDGGKDVGILLAQSAQALPPLREAYAAAASDEDKLTYAHILGMMGDGTGLATLIDAVDAAPRWDEGWRFKAMGQFGSCMSRLDSRTLALGRIGDRKAIDAILGKTKLLDSTSAFSHHRCVALALEMLGDAAAVDALADLLAKPGMTGHAILSVERAKELAVGLSRVDTTVRDHSLRELLLARALYRCGDKDGIGEGILKQYATDLRGHFARHAKAVLERAKR